MVFVNTCWQFHVGRKRKKKCYSLKEFVPKGFLYLPGRVKTAEGHMAFGVRL